MKRYFQCFLSTAVLLASLNGFSKTVEFRTAVLAQDANDKELVGHLQSAVIKKQKQALIALTKITTNESLKLLLQSRSIIFPTNTRQYCNALGQKHLINETTTGFAVDAELKEAAISLLAEMVVTDKNAPTHCFEAFAKLSTRAYDAKLEELFKSFQIEDSEKRKALSAQNLSQILVSLYFHRMTTFDAKNPADRYWFSPEFSAYLRTIPLDRNPSMLVRQSWARIAYLANDDLIITDYTKLIRDADVVTKVISLELVNFVNKTDATATLTALKEQNFRVVNAAIANMVRLKKEADLYSAFKNLLTHPQWQIRRSMLDAVKGHITLDEVVPFLKDPSNSVKHIAAQIYLKLNSEGRVQFATEALAGNDFGLKKGVIEGSSELGDQRTEILLKALNDSNVFIKNFALSHIQSKKVEALYPEALKYLTAENPEQRVEAVKILIANKNIEERLEKLVTVFTNSQSALYEYPRSEIIKAITSSAEDTEKALIPKLLSVETNWRYANLLGEALKKQGGSYAPKSPQFESTEADAYKVEISHPIVLIKTTKGNLVFELFNDIAPLHVAGFLYALEQGMLTKNFFHRVEDHFVVQASRPFVSGRKESGTLRAEILGLRQSRGTLAMPRNEYLHSGRPENIYINLNSNFGLNFNYTVFGRLIAGDDVLDQLEIGDSIIDVNRLN